MALSLRRTNRQSKQMSQLRNLTNIKRKSIEIVHPKVALTRNQEPLVHPKSLLNRNAVVQ